MQRLGRNNAGYRGETIDIGSVVNRGLEAARRHGWQVRELATDHGLGLPVLHRPAPERSEPVRNFYVSSGIHGDEPAGPLAMARLLEENRWPANANLWLCPCLNPTGFPLNRRENVHGIDLNRDYRHLTAPEVRAHVDWLAGLPQLDLALCLHEDWEAHGFYLYEVNPDGQASLSEAMLSAVAPVCPIDHSPEIDGRPADKGLIFPPVDPASRPQWPEAFWLLMNKTRHSYTLEAPSDFPLPVRVDALVTAVRTALERSPAIRV